MLAAGARRRGLGADGSGFCEGKRARRQAVLKCGSPAACHWPVNETDGCLEVLVLGPRPGVWRMRKPKGYMKRSPQVGVPLVSGRHFLRAWLKKMALGHPSMRRNPNTLNYMTQTYARECENMFRCAQPSQMRRQRWHERRCHSWSCRPKAGDFSGTTRVFDDFDRGVHLWS